MKVTRGLTPSIARPYPVVSIGNFDGQHRGHHALLHTVVDAARRRQGTPMVLTFDPHPVRILAPHVELRFLTSPQEKLERFEEAGIQEVLFLEFTPAFANLTPEEFARQVLHEGIGVKELFVGRHFAFGKGRTGKIDDLVRFGERYGFRVHPMEPVTLDGHVVSSSRIRQLMQTGDVRTAARLLGRPYAVGGTVVPGTQRGRSLGWPTANLMLPGDRVVPPDGVYAAVTTWNQRSFDSVVYIGTRPTFGAGERLIEVSLLDERIDLYGEYIMVQFVDHLRGDRVFASAEELAARIEEDVRQARASLRRDIHAAMNS